MALATPPTTPTAAIPMAALERALAQHIKARRLGAGEWETTSASGNGTYTVTLDGDGGASCTCTAGRFGRYPCKHATLVRVLASVLLDGPTGVPADPTDLPW